MPYIHFTEEQKLRVSSVDRNDFRGPSAFTCATQLLHHLGRLFQDRTQRAPIRGIAITDRKLRRRIQEKKIAMGHKADDHEDAGITSVLS